MSVVYFLQSGEGGPIKIGHTTCNVYSRVTALQQASPYELRWIGYFPGIRADETAAHRKLAKSNLRNEWFHPTPEVLAFIKEKCPNFVEEDAAAEVLCEPKRLAVMAILEPYKYRRYGFHIGWFIAQDSGVSYQNVARWISEKRPLSAEDAHRVLVAAITFDQRRMAAA